MEVLVRKTVAVFLPIHLNYLICPREHVISNFLNRLMREKLKARARFEHGRWVVWFFSWSFVMVEDSEESAYGFDVDGV